MIHEFLSELIYKQPTLLIDTKNSLTPMYDFPVHTATIQAEIAIIQSRYKLITTIEGWDVYGHVQSEALSLSR